MFYCGFDPGFEASLASHDIAVEPTPTSYIWAASVLLALTIFGLIVAGTT